MRVLRQGSHDDAANHDVELWQNFLIGQGHKITADGDFGKRTSAATVAFQSAHGLGADGVVGAGTWGKALQLGLDLVEDDDSSESGPNWPEPPGFQALTASGREALFGRFSFSPSPTVSSPEAIRVTDGWDRRNLSLVQIPQLAMIPGAPKQVQFHASAVPQLLALWKEWSDAGLLPTVLTWDGSYVPRFIRGSTTTLSPHAWGTAFDINARWNPLGVTPPAVGARGSVRKLVEAANRHGFWWGGHFKGRKDGMHFEVASLK